MTVARDPEFSRSESTRAAASAGGAPPGDAPSDPTQPQGQPRRRVVVWGTYDLGKPRVRLLIDGLREHGIEVIECHSDVWHSVEDKSQLAGWRAKARLSWRWLSAYPGLLLRYLRLPPHDAVVIGYLGHLDVLLLWPLAKLRGKPMIWDAFLSLYNTVVEDRCLVTRGHPLASLLFAWEWLACRAAATVVTDTAAHGRYFTETFGLAPEKIQRVFVGAEPDLFYPAPQESDQRDAQRAFTLLFYGQFIPLHGIETIVRAAKLTEGQGISWQLIGTGQQAAAIRALIAELTPCNLSWESWVPYANLVHRIHAADTCLGIFGTTDKAQRVIPNKVFQIIAGGRPLITADTPAVRELLVPNPIVRLIPPGDPASLASAARAMADQLRSGPAGDAHASLRPSVLPSAVVGDLIKRLPRASRP